MQRQLIAIDLDGTTLNEESKLSSLTVRTLRELNKRGHVVTIATGRPYRSSAGIYEELGIRRPMINYNGALCHFPGRTWSEGYHESLRRDIAVELLDQQDKLAIDLMLIEGEDQLYSRRLSFGDEDAKREGSATIGIYDWMRLEERGILSRETVFRDPTALLLLSQREHQRTIQENVNQIFGDYIDVKTWGGEAPVLEVVRHGIHKAIGVDRVARYYQIDAKNVIAFGDEQNDLEMLDYAGTGVMMANGNSALQSVADEVTEYSNNEDGLARFLIDRFKLEF